MRKCKKCDVEMVPTTKEPTKIEGNGYSMSRVFVKCPKCGRIEQTTKTHPKPIK